MSQEVQLDVTSKISVLLTKDGVAVIGLAFGDLSCSYRKAGAGAFVGKVLDGTNFTEIGQGYYDIEFDGATELDVDGVFVVVVTGADIDRSDTDAVVVLPPESTTAVALLTCKITGNLNGPSGPIASVAVFARAITPQTLNGTMLSVEPWTTSTDENGAWVLSLPRGAVMEIVAPMVGFLRRLTVPNRPSAVLAEIP